MILKGRSRGHGSQLARYLFHAKNETVKVLDVQGTCASEKSAEGLIDALKEFDEYGKLTRGEKTIFHLAIAPADYDRMDGTKWQYAVTKAEEALGLQGQPRVVVMHAYEGKEHLHVAWSRVDLETHKLKSDSFTNLKLCNAARDIELELGLSRLPDVHRGHDQARRLQAELRDAREPGEDKASQRETEVQRFTERQGNHGKQELKRVIASAWHRAGSGEEFRERLERQGFQLVRGERGLVVMDAERNVYSPARYIEGVKVKDVNGKCAGIAKDLPTVEEARFHGRDAIHSPQKETILTPRKAARLTRTRLRLEIANDPRQPPRVVEDHEEYGL